MFGHKQKYLPVGVDLGRDSIKLMQLLITRQGPKLLSHASEAVCEEVRASKDSRRQTLILTKRLMRAHSFVGNRIACCVPRELVRLKNIRLPMMPLSEISQAVAFEAANAFDFDLSNATLKHIVLGEIRYGNEPRIEVTCAAVLNDDLDQFIEDVHAAGLALSGLAFEPTALLRGVASLLPGDARSGAEVALDIGHRRTQVMMGRGGSLQFYKAIDFGSQHLTAAVARKLSLSEPEAAALRMELDRQQTNPTVDQSIRDAVDDAIRPIAVELAREVALCLRYFGVTFRGVRIKQLHAVGGEANCQSLLHWMRQELPVPLEALSARSIGGSEPLSPALWALPFALALPEGPEASAIQPSSPVMPSAANLEVEVADV